jgi:hypothetical protein
MGKLDNKGEETEIDGVTVEAMITIKLTVNKDL